MAKSVFRRFPSDDIDLEPYTGEDDIGQSLIKRGESGVQHLVFDDFFETAGTLKRWNGSAWVVAKPKRYTGAAWTAGLLKRWNGAAWEIVATR